MLNLVSLCVFVMVVAVPPLTKSREGKQKVSSPSSQHLAYTLVANGFEFARMPDMTRLGTVEVCLENCCCCGPFCKPSDRDRSAHRALLFNPALASVEHFAAQTALGSLGSVWERQSATVASVRTRSGFRERLTNSVFACQKTAHSSSKMFFHAAFYFSPR
jgi:hypothetical protein